MRRFRARLSGNGTWAMDYSTSKVGALSGSRALAVQVLGRAASVRVNSDRSKLVCLREVFAYTKRHD